MKLSDLIHMPVVHRPSQAGLGICTDVLVDVEHNRIVYFLLSATQHADHPMGLVSSSVVRLVDDSLSVEIDEADAGRLRALRRQGEADGPLDLMMMPMTLTGPFGYTVAPAMASALMNARLSDNTERPDVDEKHKHWHWASRLSGLPIFDESGELGHVEDIEISARDFSCAGLLLRDPQDISMIDFARVLYVAKGETSIIVSQNADTPPWTPDTSIANT